MVVGVIAGGAPALQRSREGAEDDREAARQALRDLGVGASDVIVGIAASGTTPYVRAALESGNELGAATVLVTCSDPPDDLGTLVDESVVLRVGPEALTGSTRLKAGTATKLTLNTITTGAMLRMGKAYGNLMVDLMALSDKLHDRGERIVMEITGVDRTAAREAIAAAGGSVKTAIVMVRREVDAAEAARLLDEAEGVVRAVIGDPPPMIE
jgi:N-acetylmuramic acid 6-phosphate etherase